MSLIYLAEITCATDAAGTLSTLRFGTAGYNTRPTDTPASTHFAPSLSQAALIQRDMYSGGKIFGRSSIGYGEMVLINNDGGLDYLLDYGFDGRDLTLKLGDSTAAYSTFTTVLEATMEQVDFDDRAATIRIKDKMLILDRPVCSSLYGGTNVLPAGVDGEADIKGKNKPFVFGSVLNIQPVQVNTSKLIFQASTQKTNLLLNSATPATQNITTTAQDYTVSMLGTGTCTLSGTSTGVLRGFGTGTSRVQLTVTATAGTLTLTFAGSNNSGQLETGKSASTYIATTGAAASTTALNTISKVYDKGLELTKGADYTSQADMEGTAPAAAGFRVWPAGGMFRLGSALAGAVTCDCAQGANSAARTVAQVLKAIAATQGIVAYAADVTALDAANSAECGLYLDDDTSALDAMDAVAESIGAWYGYDTSGRLRMGQLIAPSGTPVVSLTVSDIISLQKVTARDDTKGLPVWRVTLGYQKNYTKQETDLAGAVTAARRAILSDEYRTAAAEDASIKIKHMSETSVERNSLLLNKTAAETEAARLLTLLKTRKDTYEVNVRSAGVSLLDIGKVIQVTYPRFGLSSGKLCTILAIRTDLANNSTKMTLWG